MGLRDEHGAPRSVPIAVWILRALVTAARRARLKMDSEGGFLGDKRLVVVAIAIIDASPIDVRDAAEIERAITRFARSSNDGLIVTGGSAFNHRELIITLATRHRLPAVYSDYIFVTEGGLMSYGPDRLDQFRRAAGYVDRILRGEKPADLPVQAPT